jgi:WD40 repeat protein
LQHEDIVISAVFSPDGSKILTASGDNTARVWDAATGRALSEPLQHEDIVISAVFSPDGSKILTASKDNTARVWSIAPPSNIPIPKWLAPLAEAVAEYRLNDQSILEPVEHAQLLRFRERFRNSKDKDPYSQIARWFFADKATRPASPYNMDLPAKGDK